MVRKSPILEYVCNLGDVEVIDYFVLSVWTHSEELCPLLMSFAYCDLEEVPQQIVRNYLAIIAVSELAQVSLSDTLMNRVGDPLKWVPLKDRREAIESQFDNLDSALAQIARIYDSSAGLSVIRRMRIRAYAFISLLGRRK